MNEGDKVPCPKCGAASMVHNRSRYAGRLALRAYCPNKCGSFRIAVRPQRESKNPEGLCQVCFRTYRVQRACISLHGFQRPGDGYLYGRCPGAKYAPFEVSCERTKEYLSMLRAEEARRVADLNNLQAPDLQSLPWNYHVYGRVVVAPEGAKVTPPAYAGAAYEITLQIQNGAPEGGWASEYGGARKPSFEELRARAIREAEARLRMLRGNIQFIELMIRNWEPKKMKHSVESSRGNPIHQGC